tara:strand:- start:2312 stop:3841 length:1530 start_codon:yes stop_codon:yes gene_type:complete
LKISSFEPVPGESVGMGERTANITILNDDNGPPTVALSATSRTLAENVSTNTRRKVADITVTDDGLGTTALSLSGADASLFEIFRGDLFLKAGAALDFETNPNLDVSVSVNDPSLAPSPNATASFDLSLADANEAPVLSVRNRVFALSEDVSTATRRKMADIVILDDALGINRLSLSGADAGLFRIAGGDLFLRAGAALDFDRDRSLDVTVRVDDSAIGGFPDDTSAITVAVRDVNTEPVLTVTQVRASISEAFKATSDIKIADVSVADDGTGANVLSLTGADAGLFRLKDGALLLKQNAALDFETNPKLDVRVPINDRLLPGGPEDSASITVAVANAPEGIVGNGGDNRLVGTRRDDKMLGGGGDDVMLGRAGDDLMKGGNGEDGIKGQAGDDTIKGQGGNDTLLGNGGRDKLDGGKGWDIIDGQKGDDVMSGGGGMDTFRFGTNDGHDVITDFRHGRDGIDFTKLGGTRKVLRSAEEIGDDVVFDFAPDQSLTVRNMTIAQVSDDIP